MLWMFKYSVSGKHRDDYFVGNFHCLYHFRQIGATIHSSLPFHRSLGQSHVSQLTSDTRMTCVCMTSHIKTFEKFEGSA
jgi:hypothetical protein